MKPLFRNVGKDVLVTGLAEDIKESTQYNRLVNHIGKITKVVGHYYRIQFPELNTAELFLPEEVVVIRKSKKGNVFVS